MCQLIQLYIVVLKWIEIAVAAPGSSQTGSKIGDSSIL